MRENIEKAIKTIKDNKVTLIVFLIGLVFIAFAIISPLLFTGNLGLIFGPDFTQDGIGQIGDVIGGTTAPIVGILGAILIYISFHQQVKANKLLEKETNRANFFKEYDTIIDLMDFAMKQYDL